MKRNRTESTERIVKFPLPFFFIAFFLAWECGIFGNLFFLHAQYIRQFRFENEHARRMHYALDDWISFMKAREVTSLSAGNEYLYVATLDGGIWRYHFYSNQWDYPFTTSNGLPENAVKKVYFDKQTGLLWAITPHDTAVFDDGTLEWVTKSQSAYWPYGKPVFVQPDTSPPLRPDFFYDQRFLRFLPVFFANGGFRLAGDWHLIDMQFREYPITGFLPDEWQRVWFAVSHFGVGLGNLFSQRADFFAQGLSDIIPRAIAFQGDDLWIGGEWKGEDRPGIVHWLSRDGSWEYYEARWISGLPDDNVTVIEVTGDSLWFGTHYGVTLYITDKNRWVNFNVHQGLWSNEVLDLTAFGSDLYIATERGLNRLHRSTGIVERISQEDFRNFPVNQLYAQGDTLWCLTNRGIYRWTPGMPAWERVVSQAAISDMFFSVMCGYKNEVWFAGPQGVAWLDVKTNRWESFPQVGMEVHGDMWDLKVNAKSVWIATDDGLLKFDKERRFWRRFTTSDGLLDNRCYYVLLDGDYLWVATYQGISQFYWNSPRRTD